jgi:hypothetical protein
MKDLPPTFDRIFERMFTRRERRPKNMDDTIADLRELLDPKAKGKAAEKDGIVKALPVSSSMLRHSRHTVPTSPAAAEPTPSLASQPRTPAFRRWRENVVAQIGEQLGEVRGLTSSDGRGFDGCYGVNVEGEPHHRIYLLLLPELDAQAARATVVEARRIFDQEKGIWEKEVTFWLIAQDVQDHNQVLWTLKSFSMGWWRRRRIVLQDVKADRLYAAELGCDPRGNPLKRMFLSACQQAIQSVPALAEPSRPQRCRVVRGTAWGAALALVMTFGILGSIMAVELTSRNMRKKQKDKSVPCLTGEDGTPILPPLPERAPEDFEPEEPREQPKYY